MTTEASGRCTSAPVEVETAMGKKPKLATQAVISTGRSLRLAPAITASREDATACRSWLIELTKTTPLSMATPNSAMNPMEADKLRFIPRNQSAAMPPTNANGTFPTTSKACVMELKVR